MDMLMFFIALGIGGIGLTLTGVIDALNRIAAALEKVK